MVGGSKRLSEKSPDPGVPGGIGPGNSKYFFGSRYQEPPTLLQTSIINQ